ncbi:MAG: hypothetical protein CMB80_00355 [Flammeovirgaceae bacterium]|jgi:hypothetical protein|nr:hypothetical protein [Flammeovirgaceae bacterium]|tara:strand:- start:4377 stop:4952 length:576 start_codon:yes stop_codon:yes gene_type:complete
MAYDIVSLGVGGKPGPTDINQYGNNFSSIAAGDSGSPAWNVSSTMVVVGSISQIHVGSGINAPETSSFANIEVSSAINRLGNSLKNLSVTQQGSNYTVDNSEANGNTVFHTNSAGDEVQFTLPGSGTTFLEFTAITSHGLRLIAPGAEEIYVSSGNGTSVSSTDYFLDDFGEGVILARVKNSEWHIIMENK